MILDGHQSHITDSLAKLANKHNVHILCLPPPNFSHALQPLDVAVFKSVKDIWSQVCLEYFRQAFHQTLGKQEFPGCLKVVWEHVKNNPAFAVNGWKKCGYRPLDRNAVDGKIVGATPLAHINLKNLLGPKGTRHS